MSAPRDATAALSMRLGGVRGGSTHVNISGEKHQQAEPWQWQQLQPKIGREPGHERPDLHRCRIHRRQVLVSVIVLPQEPS